MAEDLAVEGAVDSVIGVEDLADAGDAAAVAAAATATAASDLTRAVDAEMVADRLADLSDVVGIAGVNDMAQGVDLLSAGDDVGAMSAVVGLMSLGDAERGLALGRLAGELNTIAEVVAALEMPVLATVLDDRGAQLQEIAVDVILRAGAERGLANLMAATGQQISEMGAEEIDEGALPKRSTRVRCVWPPPISLPSVPLNWRTPALVWPHGAQSKLSRPALRPMSPVTWLAKAWLMWP